MVRRSESMEPSPGNPGLNQETDDGTTDWRLFGPRNPFTGALLGVAIFFYL